jgi:hypothetical protein
VFSNRPSPARLLVATLALVVPLCLVPTALGDADPASDVLYAQTVFYSFDKLPSDSAQKRLNETVDTATKAGYPVRVALIATPADLGAVTALWAKPRKYAPFLGLELSFVYKGSLLVVMPNGLGYYHHGERAAPAYATLRGVRVASGVDGGADAAVTAIAKLAAAAGHRIEVPPKGADSNGHSGRNRLIIVIAGLLVAQVVAVVYVLRRRESD